MQFDMDEWFIPTVVCVCIAILGVAIYAGVTDYREWERFKRTRHCKVVTKISGDVFNTVGTDFKGNINIGIASTPDKTGWLCDDGVTYYREVA